MKENKKLDIDWAVIVDVLASEYGWTIDYIRTLTLNQVIALINTIKYRYSKQEESIKNYHNNSNEEMPMSYFENELKGKKNIREDGTTEIII